MALFTIDLGLEDNQVQMMKDIFKYVILFSIFHTYCNMSGVKNLGIFGNNLFNDNFWGFLLLLTVTFMTYYLVILEIVEII